MTRKEAKLTPKHPAFSFLARPMHRRAECPLCEARIGQEHGYLYLGEGWLEAVYYSPDQE